MLMTNDTRTCKTCGFVGNRSEMMRHLTAAHPRRVKCRECKRYFESLGKLRSHQWRKHPEIFKHTHERVRATKARKAEIREKLVANAALARAGKAAKRETTKELILSTLSTNGAAPKVELVAAAEHVKKDMLVSELLGKLKTQASFMNDVVSLIERMLV